ncbi:putative enoyl-CoA hydratase/Enoyl-CoA isomerase/3-hydroxyacyl-CoA dehydrogenase [Trypanosoma rangeli]|uniref:Putative enoyl-CoA hydratase/Enoyl-CoA isomerase/3-hydroxyacyl-CoA dehydrogenase n=1 Tax=Trypanosoma rangeli TaxID=5698 RepID=A0A3R7KS65_TRYRA|nr:putative enoyl-CoA hydratase/Enoyl-CoA isomerase/3-hydroxyacyl-CoA dehydrogenase [Trypanosoma rangeli]RNF00302.1 putative enoyl-CoA hydratase/Enoyl-CoA isomerase/3-hydroxyacyl-CoA dehydrogenase [Trypanosoma rangeli]|eukprot:RNF00302.1 putative enoyl-CoA hydratase/Enoyl-CoA isomerase/3-hydroxyacyl-CoA dehydrogenase [Trypanosoma rangeli]
MRRVDTICSHMGHRRYCHLERFDDAAVLILHHELHNALTVYMRAAIHHYFCEAEADPAIHRIIITGEGNAFSCGIDVTDFRASASEVYYDGGAIPSLSMLTNLVENSSKVVVAAINGLALSGGLELALAAHYRVASPTSVFSFPEVELGIVPCGGGTQRLPRLIGVRVAIAMITMFTEMSASEAREAGLVDHVTTCAMKHDSGGSAGSGAFGKHGAHFPWRNDSVVAAALQLSSDWKTPRRLSCDNRRLGNILVNRALFLWTKRELSKRVPKGVQAPMRCLEAIWAATTTASFSEGLQVEQRLFLESLESPEAYAMQHLLRSSSAAFRGSLASLPHGIADRANIRRSAVIGCGTIGTGITLLMLQSQIPVTVVEVNEEQCRRVRLFVQDQLDRDVRKERLTPDLREQRLSMLSVVPYDTDLVKALQDVDIVVECVGEDIALKKRVFACLSDVCQPHCIIATSASAISTEELAAVTRRPEKVIGMHFIPPSHITPLLEIVQGPRTDQVTILQAMHMGHLFRKAVVLTKDTGACLTTRLLYAGLYQAFAMLEEGAFPLEVDRALQRFGFRLGVFALEDLAGLDFTARIRTALQKQRKTPSTQADVYTIPRLLAATGRLGQKRGLGWYNYEHTSLLSSILSTLQGARSTEDEKGVTQMGVWHRGGAPLERVPRPDRAVELLILDVCMKKDISRRDISEKEIVERILFSIINEAAKLLGEGAVASSADVDVAMTFGYGFPAWKGGVCYYADKLGLPNIVHRMRIYNRAFGDAVFPLPCDVLGAMVASQQNFGSMWQ